MTELLSTAKFYEEGMKGKLFGLKCEEGHVTVPPRHSCGICQSQSLSLIELSGRGKILSWTEVFSKSGEFPIQTPYVLGLVELEEGGNLLGVLRGSIEKIRYGMQVRAKFEVIPKYEPLNTERERPRIFFEPL